VGLTSHLLHERLALTLLTIVPLKAYKACTMAIIKVIDQWQAARVMPPPPPPAPPLPPASRAILSPAPSKGSGKGTKSQKGAKGSSKGLSKEGAKEPKASEAKGVEKARVDIQDMDPAERQKVYAKKMKNIRGLMSRNLRDNPQLADLGAKMSPHTSPSPVRSPSHYRGTRSPSRRTRSRSRSMKDVVEHPAAGTFMATASSSSLGLSRKQQEELDEEEREEAEQIELLKSIRPWQPLTVSPSTPFPNPQDATLTAYGYSQALISWGHSATVTREKMIAMATSMLNMAAE